ncbi:MAG: DMT family transporter [Hyphomicrobiaceae bacterium]
MAEGSTKASERGSAIPMRNIKAIVAMVMATVVFTLGDAAMKLVSSAVPTGQSVFLRCSGSVLLVVIAAIYTGAIQEVRRALVPLMAWRSAGDAGSALFFQAALARMPFADIMGVLQLTPLSLTAASAVFLGARVGWRRWLAVAAGLFGALLVIKPGSGAFNAWALLAVLSVLCGTLRDISTRRLDGSISPLVIMMLSQSAVALVSLCTLPFEPWVWPTALQFTQIAVAAACTLIGHLWVIYSLRAGEIATVAPFRYAGILWAIIIGLLVWGEVPDVLTTAGIAILISAGIYTFYRERKLARLVL